MKRFELARPGQSLEANFALASLRERLCVHHQCEGERPARARCRAPPCLRTPAGATTGVEWALHPAPLWVGNQR